jgi:hypothetical protein
MNDYTVIILFVAANPSKDISRGRKIILRKKEEAESVIAPLRAIDPNQY